MATKKSEPVEPDYSYLEALRNEPRVKLRRNLWISALLTIGVLAALQIFHHAMNTTIFKEESANIQTQVQKIPPEIQILQNEINDLKQKVEKQNANK